MQVTPKNSTNKMKTNFFYNLGKNKLFPICRSPTGRGNAKTLEIIKKNIGNLKILKFGSGSRVLIGKFQVNGM